MRTAIYTNDTTKLTIETSEDVVHLEQMGSPAATKCLSKGPTDVVVSAGVFKIVSNKPVNVVATSATGSSGQFEVETNANDKDGKWPDQLIPPGQSLKEIQDFFFNAKSHTAPV